MNWPLDRTALLDLGKQRVADFCVHNNLPIPAINQIPKANWLYSPCAFYRPKSGINVCLEKCQQPCPVVNSRNWSWPGSTTDREPYGVVAHELGHHVDWSASDQKWAYFGNYSIDLRKASGEPPITSYCDNDAEWWAEIFRVFVTNPDLLRQLRPRTYALICTRWKPLNSTPWLEVLGENVPERVIRTLRNKGAA